MKILITGGSGLLGQYLNTELSKENEILTLYKTNPRNCKDFNSAKVDNNDYDKLEKFFDEFSPQTVIHAASISSPKLAESIPSKKVYQINVNATKKISELCEKYNAKLIYTSTDLVYAGYRGSMLNEDSKLIPVSLYAETKLMGERKIQETFENYIILRTSLLYGFGLNAAKCHFHQMYNDLKEGKKIKLFKDQFRTPLALHEAAIIISELIKKNIIKEIINFGGREKVSRYQIGEKLCEAANFDKNLLVSISMDDIPNIAKVEDVSMNTEKLQSFSIVQKSIEESIKEILDKNY
ncbi:MAG: SDR family oxidoreductase [Ignavibacteriaceae bacterium]